MGRMSDKRKEELQAKYGNNALPRIESKYYERASELSSRYILFANKNNRNGLCENCNKDVVFEKTRHKEKVVCPNCGKELIAQHTWRKICDYDPDWYVVGQTIDEDTFILRYIELWRSGKYVRHSVELAREVYDYKHGWSYVFSFGAENGWKVNDRFYFREHSAMSYYLRKDCCIIAKPINDIMTELKKVSMLKHLPNLYRYYNVYRYPRDNAKQLLRANLYEKLEKVGLGEFAMEDYREYPYYNCGYHHNGGIKYKRSETSLVKMLGMNKAQYKLFLQFPNKYTLNFIRENLDMPYQLMKYIIENKAMDTYRNVKAYDKPIKVLRYLVKHNVNVYEYAHYLRMLRQLNYTLDDNYMFPKDFRKADDRVTAEINAEADKALIKENAEKSKLIKEISDGLRQMEGLQEFMNGSKGLMVYVPENAKDLITEGRRLHNCIGTYIDRIAEKKTLVFFVRKIECPNDPYVAFEYCNGEVVQCRADNNDNVKDANIISFVDAFAERLRRNKVLCAA